MDLMRYIGGDVDPGSVVAAAVGPGYPLSETALLAPEGEAPVRMPLPCYPSLQLQGTPMQMMLRPLSSFCLGSHWP